MKHRLLLLFLFIQFSPLFLISKEIGKPFLTNFSSKDFKGHTQNWVIETDQNGITYFGNQAGVMVYDGLAWRTIEIDNHSTVRSLCLNSDGKIYVGAVGEFGYLETDATGKLVYKSLIQQIDSLKRNFADVWNCQTLNNKVYFLTDNYIYIWDGKLFSYIKTKGDYFYSCFALATQLYVQDFGYGFCILENNTLRLVPNREDLVKASIHSVLPFNDTAILIGERTNGPFLMNTKTGEIRFLSEYLKNYFRKKELYHAEQLDSNTYAFATLKNGIIIINKQGDIIETINKTSGLQDDMVYYLKKDGSILWAALEKGIAKVEYEPNIRFWNETSGLTGSITDIVRFNNHIYTSTGSGVFKLNQNSDAELSMFQLNDSLAEQSWDLQVFSTNKKDFLLAATGKGLYKVEDNRAYLLYRGESIFKITPSKHETNRIYLGMKGYLSYIDYDEKSNHFSEPKLIQSYNSEIRDLVEDSVGNLWAGLIYTGVAKITLTQKGDQTEYKSKIYATESGIKIDREIHIINFQNKWRYATEKGVFIFQTGKDTLIRDSLFEKTFHIKNGKAILFNQADNDNIWINGNSFFEKIGTTYVENKLFAKRLPEINIESQFSDSVNNIWLGTSEGIFRIKSWVNQKSNTPFRALIRKITTNNDSTVFWGNANPQNKVRIKHKNNLLRFYFVSPDAYGSKKLQYSFMLKGYDENWSDWNSTNTKDYTNLFEKTYTFKVKAKNYLGEESLADEFTFTVLPPIHRTFLAYLLYLIIIISSISFIVNFRTRKLRADKLKLEHIIQKRTNEIRSQKEKIENTATSLALANEELKKLSVIAQKTDNAVAIFDEKGDMEWVNNGFILMYGYTFEEFTEKKGRNIISSSGNPNIKHTIQQCIDKKETTIYQFHTLTKNETDLWVQTTLTPILNEAGNLTRLIAIDSDITKIKDAEHKIESQRDELQKTNETKDKFFSIIAHDLRGPLSGIFTLLNILHNDFELFDQEQIKTYIAQLRETTGNTFNLTENLLDWAHLRRDGIKYNPTKLTINDIIEENKELFGSLMDKKNIAIINALIGNETAFADEEMVKTIVRNLLGNAIKFTESKGQITISSLTEGNYLWISITDTGKGMEPWEIEKLFRIDTQHSTLGTNKEKGSGLGLILTHGFVTKNKGKIRVESSKGNGSTFSFSLPLTIS